MSATAKSGARKPVQKWVPDEKDGFVIGEVIQENADGTTNVRVLGATEKKVKTAILEDVNPPKFDKIDDMANMGFLSEATVLFNLKERFHANMIYTYSGLFLVAINPYKTLPLYTDKVLESYKGKRRNEAQPHVFAIADQAYRQMIENRENQSMLITGESGAGKTVNTKRVLQYLAATAGTKVGSGRGELEEQILQSNPILEAWGNAKTIRNDNSSRFGKFIEVQFTMDGRIAGGVIESYLLEKSRVSFQAENERNYHIFYYLLKGAPEDMKRELHLTCVEDYTWLRNESQNVKGLDDIEEYNTMMGAFDTMGMGRPEIMQVFRITSAILHMGNASRKFQSAKRTDEAIAPEDCMAELGLVEELLGVERDRLVTAVLRPRIKAGMEWVNRQRTQAQAKNLMEALAKSTYERLFGWIVHRINVSLQNHEKRELFIGVLDISGFEIFKINSFEQLCINYTNERLQQFFNNHMFKLEQEEYLREQIEWTMIDFGLDLQGTIDLIEQPKAPFGVLSVLEDQCNFPKASDETFVAKLTEIHAGKHPNFTVPKFSKVKFNLKHYAGEVEYVCDDWLEKNRDKLDDAVAVVMQDSRDEFVMHLFEDLTPEREGVARISDGKRGPRPYVSVGHKAQLERLMGVLRSTSPHFIRCIKPNEEKRMMFIESHMVLDQLRCNGVLEGIRICRKGYPNRMKFGEFRDRYKVCAPGVVPDSLMDSKEATRMVLDAIRMDKTQYKLGLTKVFFKAGRLPELEMLRDKILGDLLKGFQALLRGYWARNRYDVQQENTSAITVVQKSITTYFQMRDWSWFKLFSRIRPMIKIVDKNAERERQEEEMRRLKQAADEEAEARRTAMIETDKLRSEILEREKQAASDREKAAAEREKLQKLREEEVERERKDKERLAREAADRERQLKMDSENALREAERRKREEADKMRAEMEARTEEEKRDLMAKAAVEKERLAREKEAERKMYEEKRLQTERELDMKAKEFEAAKAKTTKQLLQEQEERKSEYEKRIKLEDEVKRLDRRVTNKEEELESERKERAALDQMRKKAEQELRNAKLALQQEQSEKSKLEETRKIAETRLDEMALELQAKDDAANRIAKQKTSMDKDVEELQDQLQTEEKNIAESKRQLQKAQKEIQDLKARLNDAEAAKQKYQREKRKLEARVKSGDVGGGEVDGVAAPGAVVLRATTDAETRKLQLEIRRLRERLATAEAQKQAIERNIEDYRNELDELRSALEDESKARMEADREARDLRDQLRETHELLEEKTQEGEDETLLRQAQEAELEEARRMVAQAGDAHLQELETKRKKWEEAITQLRNELDEEARSKTELQKALNKVREEQQAVLDRADEADRAVRDANQGRAKLEFQVTTMKDQLGEKERLLNQAQAVAKKATAEQNSAQGEIDALKRDKAAALKAVRGAEAEAADAKRSAQDEVVARQEAESQLNTITDDLREAQARAEDAEEETDRLKDEVRRTLEEMEVLRAAMKSSDSGGGIASEDARNQLTAQEQELAALREDLEEERRKRMAAERRQRQIQTELDEQEDKLESQTAAFEAATSARRLLETDLKNARTQIGNMQESALRSELALKEVDARQAEMSNVIAQLETARDNEMRERKGAQQRLKEAEDHLSEQRAITEQVERSKKQLQEEIVAVKEELEDSIEERMKAEDLRRRQFEELVAARAALESQQADPRAAAAEQERTRLAAALDEAHAAAREQERNTAGLQKQLHKAQDDAKSAQTALHEAVAAQHLAEKLSKKHQGDAGKSGAKLSQAAKDVASAQREAQQAVNQRDEMKARVQILEKAKISLEASKQHLELQVEDLRDALKVEQEQKSAQIVRRRELEDENKALQQKITSGSDKAEALNELNRVHILQIADVKKAQAAEFAVQIEALENAKRELRSKMEELKERVDEAEREKGAAEKQKERSEREARDAVSRLDDEIKSRIEIENKHRALTSENKDLAHKASLAHAQYELAQEEKKTLVAHANEASSKVDEAERRAAVAEAQAQHLQVELDVVKASSDDFAAKNADLEDQVNRVRSELEDTKTRLDEEVGHRRDWEESKETAEEAIRDLQDRLETEKQDHQHALEEQRKALVKEAKELSERCERDEKRVMELEKDNRRLASTYDQVTDDLNAANRAKIELEKGINRLETDLAVKAKALQEETQLRTEAEANVKRLVIENKDLSEQVKMESQAKETQVAKSRAAEKRLQTALMELEDERAAFTAMERTASDVLDQLEDAREKLENAEANARSVDQTTMKLEQEIGALNEELVKTDEANARLEKSVNTLKREISQLRAQLDRSDGLGKNAMDRAKQRYEDKIAELTGQLKAETQARLNQQKECRRLDSENRRSGKEATTANKKAKRLEKSLAASEKRVEQLKEELEQVAQELSGSQKDMRDLKRGSQDWLEAKANLEKDNENMKKALDREKKRLFEFEVQIKALAAMTALSKHGEELSG